MKKPSDLIIPFSFEKRRPAIIDKFFFIPQNYHRHQEWGRLDVVSNEIFEIKNPINIEYCSGNGQWILEKAKNYPNVNWIAVELRFDKARKIWVKLHNMGLKNIFVVFGEGFCFTKNYLKDESVSNVFINFPDPWPKRRHEKHRLVNPPFMKELSRIVVREGSLTFVTDDDMTKEWMLQAAILSEKWNSLLQYPHFIDHIEDYGGSYFNSLWRAKGKAIKYLQFSNIK